MEVVAEGEELIFIAMKRKSGGELDLGCESVEKLIMKSDLCDAGQGVRIGRSWHFDSGVRGTWEVTLAMVESSARLTVLAQREQSR